MENPLESIEDKLSKPPKPLMSKEEFEALPYYQKCILICNMPGCNKVVSTHGLLCVCHIGRRKWIDIE